MDTYNSTMKINAFRKNGLLMDKHMLNNTMDFNMMSIIDHSIQMDLRMATKMIFAYLDEQPANGLNYFLTMKSLENILDNGQGDCLCFFLENDYPTTTLSAVMNDDRLDANQSETYVDYFNFDHTDCWSGQKG